MKINPRKEKIFCFESPACLEKLIVIMVGIIEGDKIPPVNIVFSEKESSFQIYYLPKTVGINDDGGHHRVLSHYLLGKEMEARMLPQENFYEIPEKRKLHPAQIVIRSDAEEYLCSRVIKNYKNLPSSKEFFNKYLEINKCLKYGTWKDYSLSPEDYNKMYLKVKRELNSD